MAKCFAWERRKERGMVRLLSNRTNSMVADRGRLPATVAVARWATSIIVGLGVLLGAGAVAATTATASSPAPQTGYWVMTNRGAVTPIGGVPNYSPGFSLAPTISAVSLTPTPDNRGYWIVTSIGNVYNFGDATWYGSPAAEHRTSPAIVGFAPTPDGRGYWVVTNAGNVMNFGDAGWYGSPAMQGGTANPVIGMTAASQGKGYFLVTNHGNVYNYGSAIWRGSPAAAGITMGGSDISVSVDPATGGYWVATSGGYVYGFGAPNYGSFTGSSSPMTSFSPIPDGGGYRLVSAGGGVFDFGDATYFGVPGSPTGGAFVAIAGSSAPATVVRFGHGTWGYDVSWPQCGGPMPGGSHTIAVVGVTDGYTYSMNPCLTTEAAWAGQSMNLYINLNQPSWNPDIPGTSTPAGSTGPAGTCAAGDQSCVAFNYGWNSAQWAVNQAAAEGVHAPTWWLDVEIVSSAPTYWSSNSTLNARTIAGSIAALQSRGIVAGIYSTDYQWSTIAGSYRPNVPVWYPTGVALSSSNPQALCTNQPSFAGQIWMVQGGAGQYDGDYSC